MKICIAATVYIGSYVAWKLESWIHSGLVACFLDVVLFYCTLLLMTI